MSGARLVAKISVVVSVLALVGVVVTLVLNMFVLDGYNAYGEVPIPGSASLRLPAGAVTLSFHTRVISSPTSGGLPIPEVGLTIIPPEGVPVPTVTENVGVTTTVNNDSRRRVGSVQVPVEGVYTIRTDGQVGGFISPRLAFGRASPYGFLVWVFAALFVGAVLAGIVLSRWSARRRRAAPTTVIPAASDAPDDTVIRLEQLKTIVALRDSGALTEAEFEAEKRRILSGD